MKKLPTVTVGIPAYNEEANIGKVIGSILKQRNGSYKLERIIIVSDGSSDNTCKVVKKFKNRKVLLIEHASRKGKAIRINELLKRSSSDLLILVDADVVVKKDFFYIACKAYRESSLKIGIITGEIKPITVNLFSRIVASGHSVARRIGKQWKEGANVYTVHGACVIISKTLYKSINLPKTIGTDAFLYFCAKEKKLNIVHLDSVSAYYAVPSTLKDHLKQSIRFLNSQKKMSAIFGRDVLSEYQVPKKIILNSIVGELKKSGIILVGYSFVRALSFIKYIMTKKTSNGVWDIASTTKKISV